FAVLFQELTLIRWLPGQVRVLAYFPNLILVSAFLGLGLGCLRAHRLRSQRNRVYPELALGTPPPSLLRPSARSANHQRRAAADSTVLHRDGSQLLAARSDGRGAASTIQSAIRHALGYYWDIVGSLVGILGFTMLGVSGVYPVLPR